MAERHITGRAGEAEVVSLVACPNCRKPLMALPRGYPLYDVQCTGCLFRAQVKTSTSPPRSSILGAGWDILSKVLKSGYLPPPLIVNFKWPKGSLANQVIHFYPFVPRSSVRPYQLSPTAKRANYRMFCYVGLDTLPHFVLYSRQS